MRKLMGLQIPLCPPLLTLRRTMAGVIVRVRWADKEGYEK